MAENDTSLQEAAPDSTVVAEPNAQLAEFQAALEAGKALFLLDGLDELFFLAPHVGAIEAAGVVDDAHKLDKFLGR